MRAQPMFLLVVLACSIRPAEATFKYNDVSKSNVFDDNPTNVVASNDDPRAYLRSVNTISEKRLLESKKSQYDSAEESTSASESAPSDAEVDAEAETDADADVDAEETSVSVDKTTTKKSIRIACVGDSLTAGSEWDDRVASYPKVMRKLLEPRGFEVLNFGSHGSCVQSDCDQPYWTAQKGVFKRKSLSSNPDIVIIMFGTNDARVTNWNENSEVRFREDYADMIRTYQQLPSGPMVFICVPPPIYCQPGECWIDAQPRIHVTVFPKLVTEIAHQTGALVIDIFTALGGAELKAPKYFFEEGHLTRTEWANQRDFPYDGIHPNVLGNIHIAEIVASRILGGLLLVDKVYQLGARLVTDGLMPETFTLQG